MSQTTCKDETTELLTFLAPYASGVTAALALISRQGNSPDVRDISRELGVEVMHTWELPDSVSGAADVIDGRPYIFINRRKPLYHRRYTIAHELAHHVLRHLDENRTCMHDKEIEANTFATFLLVRTNDQETLDRYKKENPEYEATSGALTVLTFGSVAVAGVTLANWLVPKVWKWWKQR